MTIQETQYNLIRGEIVQRELQKGEFPSTSYIEKLINEQFEGRITGLPRFIHRAILKGQTSSSDDYNNMLKEIREDLIVGFEEVRNLNNQIMALASYYDSARIRVQQDLKVVELKSEVLKTRAQSHVNRDVIGDNINDFSMIEFNSDSSRNIPKTNAFIDLRHSEVSLDRVKNSTVKHDISGANITLKTSTADARMSHLAPLQNCLQDGVEDSWRSVISIPRSGGVKAQLDLELEAPAYVTTINIDMQVGKPVTATLFTSLDGEYFTEYETRKVYAGNQWIIERKEIQYIRFEFDKIEEDIIDGTSYGYIFGAKKIEVKDDQYTKQVYFVSKAFAIHNHEAIDYIHLEAEDYQPPGTHIRYYVGLDYGTNLIEWQELQKDRPIEMKMIQDRHLEIDGYADGYNELRYTNFGQAFYSIAKLPSKPLPKSVVLQMGRNMWTKETIAASFTDVGEGVYPTTMKDWIRVGSPVKMYMNIDSYQDILEKDTFQRYTTYVYMEEAANSISGGTITVGEQASYSLYVNNNRVKSVNDKYQLSFKAGWNKIEVITYAKDYNQEILFNLYLREVSDRIYANSQALQEVSLYDLLNNTSNRVYNRFAVDDSNTIIVNYNPKELDIQRNGVEYTLDYRYSVTDKDQHQIRMMAILSKESDDISVSPRLKDYRLIIE